jgi:enoyl-CoA hydratase/carnithine racemase
MQTFSCLNVSVGDRIAHIQLNRPQRANALDGVMWHELKDAFEWVDQTAEARVAILSGAGTHFSAGIDFELVRAIFAEVGEHPAGRKEERLRHIILELQAAFTALEVCRKPVLGAIHGYCIGGGLDLVAACDMRYASAEARFSLKEVDLGIVADVGSLQRLPYLIGEGKVRELAFTGREFSATEAAQMGLVNQVFADPQQLFEGVRTVAAAIAAKPPLTVRGIKEVLNYSRDHSVSSGLNFVATWNAAMLLSEDSQEAMAAVMEKRDPRFKD